MDSPFSVVLVNVVLDFVWNVVWGFMSNFFIDSPCGLVAGCLDNKGAL